MTALKTLTARIRASKTELEDWGGDTEGMATSVSKLRKELLALTNGTVDVLDANGAYKSTYEILKELASVWDNLSDITKADILEKISGKRLSNVASAIITNFDVAEEVMVGSMNAAGSAMEENARYLDSIKGKTQQLSAAWQEFSNGLLDNNLVKLFIDLVRGVVNLFNVVNRNTDNFVAKLGDVLVAIGAITIAAKTLRAVGLSINIPSIINGLTGLILTLKGVAAEEIEVATATNTVSGSLAALNIAAPHLALILLGVAAAIGVAVTAYKSWKAANPTTDELLESAKETSIELESLQDELKSVKDHINEIQKSGSISVADEAELRQLQAQNAELEREINLLRAEQEIRNKASEKSAIKDIDRGEANYWMGYTDNLAKGSSPALDANMDTVRELREEIEAAQLEEQRLINEGASDAAIEKQSGKIDKLQAKLDKAKLDLADSWTLYTEQRSKISGVTEEGQQLLDEQIKKQIEYNQLLGKSTPKSDVVSVFNDMYEFEDVRKEFDKLKKKGELTGKAIYAAFQSEDEDGPLHSLLNTLTKVAHVDFEESEEGFEGLLQILYPVAEAAEAVAESIGDILDGIEALSKASSTLESAQKDLSKGHLTESTLDAISGYNKAMKDVVALYRLGLVTGEDVYNRFKTAYDSDKAAFLKDNRDKIAFTQEFYNKSVKGNAEWAKALGSAYTSDYRNWKNLENDKLKLDNELRTKLAKGWQKYYATSSNAVDAAYFKYDTKSEWTRAYYSNLSRGISNTYSSYEDYLSAAKGSQLAAMDAATRAKYNSDKAIAAAWDAYVKTIDNSPIDLTFPSTNTNDGGSSADVWGQAAKDAIKIAKHKLEMEVYTLEEYYAELRRIENAYYLDTEEHAKKYEEEIWDLDEEIFGGRIALLEDYVNDHNRIAEKAGQMGNIFSSTTKQVNAYSDEIAKAKKRVEELADQYNKLINGNLDYHKRPIISGKDMQKYYPEFDAEDYATTYYSTETFTTKRGGEFTIMATPILENGEVLSPEALSKYIGDIVYSSNNISDVLKADKYNLIAEIRNGDWEENEKFFNQLLDKISDVKNAHLDAALALQEYEELAKKSTKASGDSQIEIYETTLSHIDEAIEQALKEGYDENGEFVQKLRDLYKDAAEKITQTMMDAWSDYESYMDNFNLWNNSAFTKNSFYESWLKQIDAKRAAGGYDGRDMDYIKDYNDVAQKLADNTRESINTVISTVIDLIEKEADEYADALDDQIDKLSDIINLKKELLEQTKSQLDHEEDVAERVREISKLQSRINQLSLDDSREAAAKRAELEEELATKNRELSKAQRDYSYEQTSQALDDALDLQEKNAEALKKVKEKEIDTWQKKYDLAIKMIDKDWAGTYSKIIDYSKEFSNSIDGQDSIKTACDNVTESIKEWGVQLKNIEGIYKGVGETLGKAPSIASVGADGSVNLTGTSNLPASQNPYKAEVESLLKQMEANSKEWHNSDAEGRKTLAQRNQQIGKNELPRYGIVPTYDDGDWKLGNELLYDWARKNGYVFHKGGVVGANGKFGEEVMAVVKTGELVLTEEQQRNLAKVLSGPNQALMSILGTYTMHPGKMAGVGGDTFAPSIGVTINHNGSMSDSDAKRYGDTVANTALEKLREAFVKRGKS